jgi:hypothetical protein
MSGKFRGRRRRFGVGGMWGMKWEGECRKSTALYFSTDEAIMKILYLAIWNSKSGKCSSGKRDRLLTNSLLSLTRNNFRSDVQRYFHKKSDNLLSLQATLKFLGEDAMDYHFLSFCKEQWELIYYVAFVILTFCIFLITVKTYLFQTKRVSEIFCKCVEKTTENSYESNVFLEIYNHGNDLAKNIKVQVQNKDFGIIPFLKPDESYMLYLGSFMYTFGGKIIQSNYFTKNISIINVHLE